MTNEMKELISEIENYADLRGISPATVVRYATGGSYSRFRKMKGGDADLRLSTVAAIRAYMAAN